MASHIAADHFPVETHAFTGRTIARTKLNVRFDAFGRQSTPNETFEGTGIWRTYAHDLSFLFCFEIDLELDSEVYLPGSICDGEDFPARV